MIAELVKVLLVEDNPDDALLIRERLTGEGGDSLIADVIILLRYLETSGVLRRGTTVIKMRGSQHDKVIREFTIDGQGMHVGQPFKNVQNIILGTPSSPGASEQDHLQEMFRS